MGKSYEDEQVGLDSSLENIADGEFATGRWHLEISRGSDRVSTSEG